MSKSTISTFELFQMFPDQESARVYFEARRRPPGLNTPRLQITTGKAHTTNMQGITRLSSKQTLWMALTLIGIKTRYGNYEMTADCSMRMYDNHAAATSAAQALVA